MFFHHVFGGESAAGAFVVERFEVGGFGGVGDGDDLDVVELEEVFDVAACLSACADDGDVDLFAWGDEFWSAEDVAWDDVEAPSGCGCCGGEESAAALAGDAFHKGM